MSIRWTGLGAVTLALAMAALLTSARAADPNFCGNYARMTLNQVRIASEHGNCAYRAVGPRWSNNFAVHYNWCLSASYDAAQNERFTRKGFLDACTHGG